MLEEIIDLLATPFLEDLALVSSSDDADTLFRAGWDRSCVFVVRERGIDLKSLVRPNGSLRRLALVNLEIDSEGLRALSELSSLTSLELDGNRIGNDGARVLARLTRLTALSLNRNRIGDDGARALAGLKNLTSLELNGNKVGAEGIRALSKLSELRELELMSNGIGVEGARALARLKRLTKLNLSDNRVGDEGARALARLTGLLSLSVGSNEIGDEGVGAFARLTQLTSLSLEYNRVGDDGAQALVPLEKLSELELYNNEIGNDGARALASLVGLTSLTLAVNEIEEEGGQALAALAKLTFLDLTHNKIRDAGARAISAVVGLAGLMLFDNDIGDDGARALAALRHLVYLDLGDNRIGIHGALALASLPSLEHLDLSGNRIEAGAVRALASPSLKSLDLSYNAIGPEGARALASLAGLRQLHLDETGIEDEGVAALASLTALTELHLRGNGITNAGARALTALKELSELHLNDNKIRVMGARALASLPALKELELRSNHLGDGGARALASLQQLTRLDLGRNGIGPVGARALAGLSRIEHLELAGNRVGDEGATVLSSLTALRWLDLSSNELGDDGVLALVALANLRYLHLRDNRISDGGASALGRLCELNSLWLENNRIGDAGVRALGGLTELESLMLEGNPITVLPAEVLKNHDARAIFAAYRRYASAPTELLNEAKLLVVGDEAVGKTSLIRYLTQARPRDPSERKTPGIAAHEQIETRHWSPIGEGPRLNVWDFGGQEILHGTHKFFLTRRSIYLLVLEDRREDDTSVYQWLRTIANRAGDSPVIVVINKCDDGRENLRLDETSIVSEWPNVLAFIRTSCNPGEQAERTIARVRSAIVEALVGDPRLSHVRDRLPRAWRRVKDSVRALARDAKVLNHQDFVRLCEAGDGEEKIGDEHEQRALMRLLHDLGVIVAYGLSDDDAADEVPVAVQAVKILDPNWLTGAIYRVLTAGLVVQQGGVFGRAQLAELLPPGLYLKSHWDFILSMMQLKSIGLCFPLRGSNGDEYLVPAALPRSAPRYDHWPEDSLRFRFDYEFLPPGLIPRLIVEGHRKVTETRWRSGAVFEAAGCQVLVRGNEVRRRIDILVHGPVAMRRSALSVILEDFKRVHELNREARPQARVPLFDNPEATVSYEHLLRLEQQHGSHYMHSPEGTSREYSVGELLDGIGRTLTPEARKVAAGPRGGGCDVLIVTALKEELDALLAVQEGIGERWTKIDDKPARFVCTLEGAEGPLRVVAVRLSKMGGRKLAEVAAPMVEPLQVRCLAMCGVCAGHPDDTDLGDVIIADRVFQHDEGKRKAGGVQGDLWVYSSADSWLYEAQDLAGPALELPGYGEPDDEEARWWFLEKLAAHREPMKSTALRRYLPDDRRRASLSRWLEEGLVQLVEGSFILTSMGMREVHAHRALDGTLVSRRPFHVHVGPIASGNAIEADGRRWHELLAGGARKTLAIEMEAAALGELAHNHGLPFVVAKGVMDHADEHKTDRFKHFACRASAEVLCRFLRRVIRSA
ncbi:COR domain-containing protein [Nannocystis sp. SCPEA4]|uniref:COR domain-containing protein n=1 Tax=Nannocystis sp. SCPEA4 TaxID=2996787 RepID=UPI002271EB76|nr:COR domain-containing protein [Nannocystis sp. SCPEA4]MCY1054925.1 50S ribosome-binding GTPase [Nannocystis sp. SCPEA4]